MAVITVTVQHRTRTHERLVRLAGEWLQARGLQIASPHPEDLEIVFPISVIMEVKVVRKGDPLRAVREAVGQLHEYRYFIGPRTAALAILLDAEPSAALIRYMEEHLQVAAFWFVDDRLRWADGTTIGLKERQLNGCLNEARLWMSSRNF